MKTYTISSVKGSKAVSGTAEEAIAAAVEMERDTQPAFGVTVDIDGETVAEVRDGVVEREDEDDEPSHAWTVTTDAVTTTIEAADEDEAARRFASGEHITGIEGAADLRDWAIERDGWCRIISQ